MANAVEAAREHVHEKTADELSSGESHRLVSLATLDPIILPLERNGIVVERDQPAVGDGEAMGAETKALPRTHYRLLMDLPAVTTAVALPS
jgi:hypothetical protein